MQKKRWIFYNNFWEEINKCSECELLDNDSLRTSYSCAKTLAEIIDINKIDGDCPLIEAETKEGAFQKILTFSMRATMKTTGIDSWIPSRA